MNYVKDVKECSMANDCEQTCVEIEGGPYQCSCMEGFTLASDLRDCDVEGE